MGLENKAEDTTATEVAAEAQKPQQAPPAPPTPEPPKMEEIITPEVLSSIIKGYRPNSPLKLVSFEAEKATKTGDNYLSVMYAVNIKMEDEKTKQEETLNVMLKTIPRAEIHLEMVNEMRVFIKESEMYQKVFPTLIKAQDELGIPKELQFSSWPKCFSVHVDGSKDFLAMENLRVEGYKMANRMVGFDFNHCALVLRNLARYHALTYAKFGGSVDAILAAFPLLKGGMFDPNQKNADMQQQFFSNSMKNQAETLRTAGEELAASRVEKLSGINFAQVLSKLIEQDIEHGVLIHGDYHINNMLFKYDEKDENCKFPVGMKIIDFQIGTASSRMVDVFYFLMTSAKFDMLAKHEEDLLMIYHSEFTSFARMLGVDTEAKGLSWSNLLREAARYRFYGICMGIVIAPMFAAESADIPEFDSFTKEDLENPEEASKEFMKKLTSTVATQKVKRIVMEHLPKCSGVEQYL